MIRILILEDDEASARLVSHILRRQGHHVRDVRRSSEAWNELTHEPADLLVLDTELDNEWGWDFLAQVRRTEVFREFPVIVYSGTWRRENIRRYFPLGVQATLAKPYSADRLQQEIARLAEMGWRKGLFSPAQPACADEARIEPTADDYLALAKQLDVAFSDARALVLDPFNTSIQRRLGEIKKRADELGCSIVVRLFDLMFEAADIPRLERLERLVDELPIAVALLHQQAGHVPPRADHHAVPEPVEPPGAVEPRRVGTTVAIG